MRWLSGCFIFIAGINVLAQVKAAARDGSGEIQVVRVQMGYVCGWCGGAGYRTDLITVERSFILREMADAENPKKFPRRRPRRAISKQEWQALVRSIDVKELTAVPQDGICRPCIDQADAWVEIDYSDGSRLSVHYDWYPGKAPPAVKALKFPILPMVFYEF